MFVSDIPTLFTEVKSTVWGRKQWKTVTLPVAYPLPDACDECLVVSVAYQFDEEYGVGRHTGLHGVAAGISLQTGFQAVGITNLT
jgi:hypothetical protein